MFNKIKYNLELTLLKIGDFLKTDIRYIAKQGSWLAGGSIINNLLSLALTIAFANLLPVDTYGTYKYILSIYGIFALFGLTGAGPAIIKTVAEGYEDIFKPALKVQMKWGVLGSLCLIFTSLYYFNHGNLIFGYGFIISAAALPFFESLNTYQHILAGKKRFDLQTKYYSATRIVSALSLIFILFFSKNVLAILIGYFLPYIVANFVFGTLSLKKVELSDKFDPGSINYIKHLSLINVISFGVSYLNNIIIFQFLGPIKLAVYSIASAPITQVQTFFGIIPELSMPKYTERPTEEIKSTLFKKIRQATIVCFLIILAFIVVVPFFFKWFLPKYIDATIYAQLLAIPLMWYPLALIPRILMAKGATRFIYESNIIISITQLVVMPISIYFYGLIGAVVGNIMVSIISYSVLYYYFNKL